LTGAATFSFKYLLNYPHEAEWTPFQTHYFSENTVAQGIEPGTSGSIASTTELKFFVSPNEAVHYYIGWKSSSNPMLLFPVFYGVLVFF
jgi:hypothetical protein